MQNQFYASTLLFALLLPLAISGEARAEGVQTAGDVLQLALPATAAALTLGFHDVEGARQLGESLAVTLGFTYGLKYTVREKRPDDDRRDSFPSGHTSISFSAAEFLRKRYGLEVGLPAYALASFVGYSRVEARQHYTQDVLAGAVIGIASSYFFTRPGEGWELGKEEGRKFWGLRLSRVW